jgi:hypothetical protein
VCDLNGYLRKILTARVYEIAVRSRAKTLACSARCAAAPAPLLCCCAPRARAANTSARRRPLAAHASVLSLAQTPKVETPLDAAPRLSERLGRGNAVLLKREDMQPVFSFKARPRAHAPSGARSARV